MIERGTGALYAADGFASLWAGNRSWTTEQTLACLIALKQRHSIQQLVDAGVKSWQIANGIQCLVKQGHLNEKKGISLARDARAMAREKERGYANSQNRGWNWRSESQHVPGWRP